MNATYQVKNFPEQINYSDTRKHLIPTYASDDPKLTKYQNVQRRHIKAVMINKLNY
jgi:hypothetical protein